MYIDEGTNKLFKNQNQNKYSKYKSRISFQKELFVNEEIFIISNSDKRA
jgi:hypothetical protein